VECGGDAVELWNLAVTGGVTLVAVLLGGWLTARMQSRQATRDHLREWRQIRLARYDEFVAVHREYVAYMLDPDTTIGSLPHPTRPGVSMPVVGKDGRRYRERLDAARTAVYLVCESAGTRDAARALVAHVRELSAAGGGALVSAAPTSEFDKLWQLERQFVRAARSELGLPRIEDPRTG
jgi:hypothetical protein